MSATNQRRSATAILTALQSALTAATWTRSAAYAAIANPPVLAEPTLTSSPGATIANGHEYSYALSYVTAEGETALATQVAFISELNMDFAIRIVLPVALDARVTAVRLWRNFMDAGGSFRLLATLAPGATPYDDVETHAVFAARSSGSPAPPVANTTAADSSTVPAFQSVKLFDTADLAAAMQELLLSQQRICLVIPDAERFESVLSGAHKLLVKRTLPVALLMSDRVLGDRQQALHGAPAAGDLPAVAGAFALQEIALAAVTGRLLAPGGGLGGVLCQPVTATVLTVEDTKKKLPGRACVELDLDCTGGTLEAATGPGPIL